MYNVEKQNKTYLDMMNDRESLSYRKLSLIHTTSQTLEFTKDQLKLIESENMLNWSIAVSDSLKSKSRLLAISCISRHDMTPESEDQDKTPKSEDHYHGFVVAYSINMDYLIYTEPQFKVSDYGGIVKLFSNHENIDGSNNDNIKKIDGCFLVILNVTGIYKYHFEHFDHKPTKIRKLRYPKRINNALKYNMYKIIYLSVPNVGEGEFYRRYILKCLYKHYFFIDTTHEGASYMELYDLKTDQLVNTFRRENSNRVSYIVNTFRRENLNMINYIADVPGVFAISNNNKFLAYKSGKCVKLYLIECGLEIASIILEDDELLFDNYFMLFFNDDEKLLVYQSENKWSIWDIFGSVQESIKLENHCGFEFGFYPRGIFDKTNYYQMERSNSLIVVNNNNKLTIYDDLILDKYNLKKSGDKFAWKTLSLAQLDRKKLNSFYHIIEPWAPNLDHSRPRYFVHLDGKNKIPLLIGGSTIQVWYDRNEKRTLEFIMVIRDVNSDVNNSMDDNMNEAVIEACHTLKYLYFVSHKDTMVGSDGYDNRIHLYKEIVKQTRNIIIRFIKLYPTSWRLLDFLFDLMSILIDAREYSLIKYILFGEEHDEGDPKNYNFKIQQGEFILHEKSLHMPQYYSWTGEENTISKAFSNEHPVLLGLFLEYYSNKAEKEIGWMITVTDIIPKLLAYRNKKRENKSEFYKYYVQLLFYKSCFCNNELDLSLFEFLEIKPSINNSLKVFIPITQLIPQDSNLEIKTISNNIIPDIRAVPLINFTSRKDKSLSLGKRESILANIMGIFKFIIFPGKYSYREEYSPFLDLIENLETVENSDAFYYNPSMEATMNFVCQSPTTYEISNGSDVIYTMAGEEPVNSFSNLFSAIIAAYNWDSISLDAWGFWPLVIIDGKRAVLKYQRDFISYYAFLERSAFTAIHSDFDSKFKVGLDMKYICFYNELSITKSWNEKSQSWKSNPIYIHAESQIQTDFEVTIDKENINFIWAPEKKPKSKIEGY
ncbi:1611_t:CDS:2 [Racocetra persica]|uniref:1611_t:CDS:1 n=1 Tax=Racocetra persica TaxID=160502 RepID=A0ACA9KV89_9GLOM|nr:1611_t:CDS:2 [Racocetra persica]